MDYVNKRNETEIEIIRAIATSGQDRPVLKLNLNYYSAEAAFPDGFLYRNYMAVLERFLPMVGAKVLWRHPVLGQATGTQILHEILAAWYPSHQAFLDLPDARSAEENFRLRAIAVEHAVIHRVSGEVYPFMPS